MSEQERQGPAWADEIPEVPDEPPSWPKVVGIISIVWGALMLGCGGCGIAWGLAGPDLMSQMMPEDSPPVQGAMGPMLIALTALGVLVDVVLIVAGVLLIQRKPVARGLHLAYAALAIVLGVASLGISPGEQRKQLERLEAWVAEHPEHPQAEAMKRQIAMSKNPAMMYGGMAVGACLGLGYPLFCLVWFGAVKRRAEDMGAPASEALV